MNLESSEDLIFELDYNKINDSKANRTPLEDITNNSYLNNYKLALIKRYYNKNTTIYSFFNNKKPLENNITSYYKKINKFLIDLLFNIYLLSSSPLRGKELTLIRFRNTSIGGIRNIFLDKGTNLIAIDTTSLNKSRDLNLLSNTNIRYLPRRLTNIVLYYTIFIIPFIEYLNIEVLNTTRLDSRLFTTPYNKNLSVLTLSTNLKTITKKYFRTSFSIKEYRYLITYIIKELIVKENIELLSPNKRYSFERNTINSSNKIEDILTGHLTLTANLNYGRDTNLFSNKTRDITNRSINFSRLYFNYFNLLDNRDIRDILDTNIELSIVKTNTSSLYSNKSNRKNEKEKEP